jgi:hypothetical protein
MPAFVVQRLQVQSSSDKTMSSVWISSWAAHTMIPNLLVRLVF